jgi:hypothetical protein
MSQAAPIAPSEDPKQWVVDFARDFTVETTPGSAAKIPDFREHLRPGTKVAVTFLPGSDFADTIAVCRRLPAGACAAKVSSPCRISRRAPFPRGPISRIG